MDQEPEGFKKYTTNISEFKKEVESLKDEKVLKNFSIKEIEEREKNLSFLVGQIHENALSIKDSYSLKDQKIFDGALKEADSTFAKVMNRLESVKKELQAAPKARLPTDTSNLFPSISEDSSQTESIDSQNQHHLMNTILSEIRQEFSRLLKDNSTNPTYEPIVGESQNAPPEQQNLSQPRIPLAFSEDFAPMGRSTKTELPTIQLQFDKVILSTFSGDHTEWITFRDEFTKYVHLNPHLSPVMKFHQLRTHLKGIALEAINGLTLSEADYEAAWSLLKERYDNERILIAEYLRRFFDLPYLQQFPTSTQFLQMVNKTNQLIRVLPLYNYDVTSWDPILMFILTSRLDNQSLRKWNDQIKKRQRIPLSELIEFLDVQAAERVAIGTEPKRFDQRPSTQKFKKSKVKKANVMLTTKESRCIQCKMDHPVYQCKTFLALDVKDRIKKVRQGKNCLSCFNTHSRKDECSFRNCKYCSQPHNDLLCYQREKELKNKPEGQKENRFDSNESPQVED